MSKHSKFSASSANRWMRCPGSLKMSEGLPDRTSAAAELGTLAHSLADECLRKGLSAWEVEVVDGKAVTEDMQAAVQNYIDLIKARGGQVLSEVRVNYKDVLGVAETDGFGTSDAVILQPDGTVEVWDLKFGHRWVDALDNPQLLLYAAGVVSAIEAVGEEVKNVMVAICQPNLSNTPSCQTLSREELRLKESEFKQAVDRVKEAEASKLGPASKKWRTMYLNPGEDQCKWCKAAQNASCPALSDAVDHVVAAAKDDEFDVVSAPALIDDDKLAQAYTKLGMLENFIKAVEGECQRRAFAGTPVPGTKLVMGREGNRKWADEKLAGDALVSVLAAETVYTKTLLSPAAAEKEIKKRKVAFDLQPLVTRSAAKQTLAPVSDPREPVAPSGGADDFN